MFGFQTLQIKPEKVLKHLKDFELFCLDELFLSPDSFKVLNEELSLSAVLHVGKRYYRKDSDGKHLIWKGLDKREYDLGPLHDMNIMRNYPGFHKTRTLALAGNKVEKIDIIQSPKKRNTITVVTMKDGTAGLGTDYKTALRNAALKMHLKGAFKKANKDDLWKKYYGNC